MGERAGRAFGGFGERVRGRTAWRGLRRALRRGRHGGCWVAGMELKPIGTLRTPFETAEGTPIQPAFAKDVVGEARVEAVYQDGLEWLDGFSHAWLVYGFHRQEGSSLRVRPFMAEHEVGVFASRSPSRPNPIGLTLARVIAVEGACVRLGGWIWWMDRRCTTSSRFSGGWRFRTSGRRAGWMRRGISRAGCGWRTGGFVRSRFQDWQVGHQ